MRATGNRGRFPVVAASVVLLLLAGGTRAGEHAGIEVHHAYGTAASFTLEGRVVETHGASASNGRDSRLKNFWRTLRSLRAEERKGASLTLSLAGRSWALRSDREGYFGLRGETPQHARPGWNPVRVATADGAAHADMQLLIVPEGETLGIISDFDDTVIVSEVPDRARLLAHTLLENHLQRRPVEGMAAFYRGLLARNAAPDAAPVIYLTASPRQLLPGIRAFLEHNGFPRGPVVAKKITDGSGGDPLLDQERYKIERIERILADLPGVRFVLVGDDGERDPEIYREIRARHPGRIEAVHIRRVSPDPARPRYPDQPEPGNR